MTIAAGTTVQVHDLGRDGNYGGTARILEIADSHYWVEVLEDDNASAFRAGDKAHFKKSRCTPLPVAAQSVLPADSEARKGIPLTTGLLDYFPAALAAVARVSKAGNDKHNPGEPLHWARGKSMDQADAVARHLMERGDFDPDTGMRQSAHLAWRALALLQLELEEAGEAPLARGASA